MNDDAKFESDEGIADAFDNAEEVHDPLDGLVEKTAGDPGAPFTPEVLEALAALKKSHRAAFETLRSQLKEAGCRVTALDEAIAEENGDTSGRGPTQAVILIDLALSAELFHAPDGTGFADLDINGHRETWPIRSKGFKRWLARCYFEATQGAPSSEALQSALNVIEAKAHFNAPERLVRIRVGELDGRLYLDLGDETWRAVEIDATGWRVIDNPPVRFRRAAGMQPLPVPVAGGSIENLRSFLNVQSDTDFVLVVAWALACLRNRGPYPVLALSGEQGSAKSTFSGILRALLDPNTAPLRALPRENRDLFIAASNSHVLAFDNVSGLPAWISDTLCRLATGGGFAVRQLYTDQDEVLFDTTRPVLLNGIEEIVTRPDLADRTVFLTLEPIPEGRRRPEGAVRARAGSALVVADYSQIELRVMAEVARDARMRDAYARGLDLHAVTAAGMLGITSDQFDKKNPEHALARQKAKGVNFGIIYGCGTSGLVAFARDSYDITMTEREARTVIATWLRTYPEVARWQERHTANCKSSGVVQTPAGRIYRFAWESNGKFNPNLALNLPVQGGAAEVAQVAIAKTDALLTKHLGERARLVGQIHDEFLVIADEPVAERAKMLLVEAMTDAFTELFPDAPVRDLVDAKIAASWSQAKA